jgi:urease accessory protein
LPRSSRAGIAALLVCLAPGTVHAHSAFPGIEGFYAGLVHPLSTAGQLLCVLALGFMLAHRWPSGFARPFGVFVASFVVGIVAAASSFEFGNEEIILLLAGMIAASITALHPPAIKAVDLILSAIGGLVIGLVSWPDGDDLSAILVTIAGSFIGSSVGLLYVAGAIGALRQRFTAAWAGIGLRVIAAWIAAITFLMTSLAFST